MLSKLLICESKEHGVNQAVLRSNNLVNIPFLSAFYVCRLPELESFESHISVDAVDVGISNP